MDTVTRRPFLFGCLFVVGLLLGSMTAGCDALAAEAPQAEPSIWKGDRIDPDRIDRMQNVLRDQMQLMTAVGQIPPRNQGLDPQWLRDRERDALVIPRVEIDTLRDHLREWGERVDRATAATNATAAAIQATADTVRMLAYVLFFTLPVHLIVVVFHWRRRP